MTNQELNVMVSTSAIFYSNVMKTVRETKDDKNLKLLQLCQSLDNKLIDSYRDLMKLGTINENNFNRYMFIRNRVLALNNNIDKILNKLKNRLN
jgi:hypothetical protein